jgi:hypothetical protein
MPSLGLPLVDSSCSLAPSEQHHSRSHSAADDYPATAAPSAPGDGRGAAEPAAEGVQAAPDQGSAGSKHAPSHASGSSLGSDSSAALDSSRRVSSAGGVALGFPVPVGAAGVQDLGAAGAAAAAGLQATAGRLAAAIQEVPGEGLEDLQPATPAERPRTQQLGPSTSEAALFESPSAAWRDLVVLSTARGSQGGGAVDAFAY